MSSKFLATFLFVLFVVLSSSSQDCVLDINSGNRETMVKVFQLNELQIEKMETLRAELEITTKGVKEDIQKLFDTHPQSTPEELRVLADKYKVLQQKMVATSRAADEKLLSTFNEKQYQRYLGLCNEAFRNPIRIIPMVVKDSIVPE